MKWRGFDDSDNTWEPEANLECPELIKAYEDERLKGGKEAKDEKRKNRDRDSDDVSYIYLTFSAFFK